MRGVFLLFIYDLFLNSFCVKLAVRWSLSANDRQ